MKAVRYERFGGPEVLEFCDVPDPTPGPAQLLIETAAIGVNFPDIRERLGVYNKAETTGVYLAQWDKAGLLPFAVNVFDARESDLASRGLVPEGAPTSLEESYKIKIGYNPIAGSRNTQPVRKEWWRPLAGLALLVVLLEWYIYNRRVYL